MNCPECDDLKKVYDDCFQEFIINRAKSWDYKQMTEDSINKCDDVFQVPIACNLWDSLHPVLTNCTFIVELQGLCGDLHEVKD